VPLARKRSVAGHRFFGAAPELAERPQKIRHRRSVVKAVTSLMDRDCRRSFWKDEFVIRRWLIAVSLVVATVLVAYAIALVMNGGPNGEKANIGGGILIIFSIPIGLMIGAGYLLLSDSK
jgi:hypothetical protein